MKSSKKVINVAKHIPTGAKVPVVIDKLTKNNVISEYHEFTDKRKGFTIAMLESRWNICREDVIELLQKYQVPVHLRYADTFMTSGQQQTIDCAIIWQEYVYGLERKEKLAHNKLKSRSFEDIRRN